MSDNTTPLFPDPPLEPAAERLFKSLCGAVLLGEVKSLQEEVRQNMLRIQAALRQNEFLDIETARSIATILISLLSEYDTFPQSQRALVIGAVRYFLKDGDAEPDTSSPLGFDDDAAVLNHVLTTIGQGHRRVSL